MTTSGEVPVAGSLAGSRYKVGDVISLKGTGVSRDLEGKYFRVTGVADGRIKLSLPYLDAACTRRYHATYPPR